MSNIKLFESSQVRTTWSEAEEKWYFVIEDVVAILTDSKDPKQYINRLRQRDKELAKGWVQFVHTLTVETTGGKQRMNCADLKGILRIIQSIPSPKAEPFKRWLAQVGSERIEEIENPEIATQRTRELYKQKGSEDNFLPEKKQAKRLKK
jgi:prophage antirepressor-like protein